MQGDAQDGWRSPKFCMVKWLAGTFSDLIIMRLCSIKSENWKNRYEDLQFKCIRSAPVFSVLSPKFGQTLDFARLQDGLIFRFDSVRGRSLRENLRCCYILVGCRYYRVIQSHTENRFIEHRRRILGFWWARPPPILSVPLIRWTDFCDCVPVVR